jgi:hypothetical protein
MRRVMIGLAILGVLALVALELATERGAISRGDLGVFTESSERDTRLPVASELNAEGAVRPVLTR